MVEKRIDELEKSVKALAIHMKNELAKLERLRETKFEPEGSVSQRLRELEKEVLHQKTLTERLKNVVEEDIELGLTMDKIHDRDIAESEKSYKAEMKKLDETEAKKIEEIGRKYGEEFEEDEALMASNMKKLMEMRQKLDNMEAVMGKLEQFQSEKEMEIEQAVSKYTTKELAEFAKVIDRKFPELATKDEFRRLEDDVTKKISMIETPDLSHIERKIDVLEIKIGQIAAMVKDIYNKLPAVVE